jgi:hypothetical protein
MAATFSIWPHEGKGEGSYLAGSISRTVFGETALTLTTSAETQSRENYNPYKKTTLRASVAALKESGRRTVGVGFAGDLREAVADVLRSEILDAIAGELAPIVQPDLAKAAVAIIDQDGFGLRHA